MPVGLLCHDLLFAPADSSRLYGVADVSLGDDVIYRSADGGASWSPVPRDGLPEGEGGQISSLAVSPTEPRTLYAATPSGVFKVTLPE